MMEDGAEKQAGRCRFGYFFLSVFLGDTFIVGRQSSFLDFFVGGFWLHRVE
jgi:hypothetical protein